MHGAASCVSLRKCRGHPVATRHNHKARVAPPQRQQCDPSLPLHEVGCNSNPPLQAQPVRSARHRRRVALRASLNVQEIDGNSNTRLPGNSKPGLRAQYAQPVPCAKRSAFALFLARTEAPNGHGREEAMAQVTPDCSVDVCTPTTRTASTCAFQVNLTHQMEGGSCPAFCPSIQRLVS